MHVHNDGDPCHKHPSALTLNLPGPSCRACRQYHTVRAAPHNCLHATKQPAGQHADITVACPCSPSMLRWMSASLSTGRSLLRPLGSPTRPVAPPSSAIGVCPHAPAHASTIMPKRLPAKGAEGQVAWNPANFPADRPQRQHGSALAHANCDSDALGACEQPRRSLNPLPTKAVATTGSASTHLNASCLLWGQSRSRGTALCCQQPAAGRNQLADVNCATLYQHADRGSLQETRLPELLSGTPML